MAQHEEDKKKKKKTVRQVSVWFWACNLGFYLGKLFLYFWLCIIDREIVKTIATIHGCRLVLIEPIKPLCLDYHFFGVCVCEFFVVWIVLQLQGVCALNCIKLVDYFFFIFPHKNCLHFQLWYFVIKCND